MNVYVFRYIFLFDKVVIVCKRKGYSYELKEIIELQSYKMSDDPMNNRDMKKVRTPLVWKDTRRIDFVQSDLWKKAGIESSCLITTAASKLKDAVVDGFR